MFNLIAYRRTGKDTLAEALINKNIAQINELNWKVYSLPSFVPTFIIHDLQRFALADNLKREICQDFDLPLTNHQIDQYKDVPLEQCPPIVQKALQKHGYISIREALIATAKLRKDTYGGDYFVRLINDQVSQAHQQGKQVILTDARDYPDLQVGNSVYVEGTVDRFGQNNRLSIRLFRSDVPIPSLNDNSEHRLDDYQTDLVFCKSESDFQKLVQIQPQYKNFTYQNELAALLFFSQPLS